MPTPGYNIQSLFRILAQHTVALKCAKSLELPQNGFLRGNHDLDALRNLLPGSWSVRDTHPDLAELTEWAVETRYPGDWPEHTDEDGTQAVSQARSVHDSVAAEFRRRGQLAE